MLFQFYGGVIQISCKNSISPGVRLMLLRQLFPNTDAYDAEDDFVGNSFDLDVCQLLGRVQPDPLNRGMVKVVEVENFRSGGQGRGEPVVNVLGIHKLLAVVVPSS